MEQSNDTVREPVLIQVGDDDGDVQEVSDIFSSRTMMCVYNERPSPVPCIEPGCTNGTRLMLVGKGVSGGGPQTFLRFPWCTEHWGGTDDARTLESLAVQWPNKYHFATLYHAPTTHPRTYVLWQADKTASRAEYDKTMDSLAKMHVVLRQRKLTAPAAVIQALRAHPPAGARSGVTVKNAAKKYTERTS